MTNRARQALRRKTETIAFRVSPEERARLEDSAIEAGLSLSGFIAACLQQRLNKLTARMAENKAPLPKEPSYKRLPPEVVNEISRIGNNLNQIAHGVNNGLPADKQRLVKKMRQLFVIIRDHNLDPNHPSKRDKKAPANDPQTAQTRQKLQRRVQVRPARPEPQDGRPGVVEPDLQPRRQR